MILLIITVSGVFYTRRQLDLFIIEIRNLCGNKFEKNIEIMKFNTSKMFELINQF